MIMENMIMEKQFIISCFPLPDEIQDHMKGFLFLDEFQAKVLKNRKEVSKILKDNLYYSCDEDDEINHPINPKRYNNRDSIFTILTIDRYFTERITKQGLYKGKSQAIRI